MGCWVIRKFAIIIGEISDWAILGHRPYAIQLNLIASFSLFSGFFPVVINFLRRLPVVGLLLNLPGISTVRLTLRRSLCCYRSIEFAIC